MDLKKLSEPLSIDCIDFRIQSINNGGYATILAYKDARVDMQRLTDVCGALGWKREHSRDNKNCIVSIWDDKNKHWVSKEDTGTESNTEQQKGLASDSFKRACFNWGIGIELYDYPLISIKLNSDELQETGKDRPKYKPSYKLNIRDWEWYLKFEYGKLVDLSVRDNKGVIRYDMNKKATENIKQPEIARVNTSEKLRSCKTLNELRDYYISLSVKDQENLRELKDKLKLKLM